MTRDIDSFIVERLTRKKSLDANLWHIFPNEWYEVWESEWEEEKWFFWEAPLQRSCLERSERLRIFSWKEIPPTPFIKGECNQIPHITILNTLFQKRTSEYLHQRIRIKMITMRMGNIDNIDGIDFRRIECYLHTALHQVSESIIREPTIDEDPHCMSIRIHDIDQELRMSERGDDHRMSIKKKIRKKNICKRKQQTLYWKGYLYLSYDYSNYFISDSHLIYHV